MRHGRALKDNGDRLLEILQNHDLGALKAMGSAGAHVGTWARLGGTILEQTDYRWAQAEGDYGGKPLTIYDVLASAGGFRGRRIAQGPINTTLRIPPRQPAQAARWGTADLSNVAQYMTRNTEPSPL